MKISIAAAALQKALKAVAPAVPRNPIIPFHSHALLVAKGDRLTVTCRSEYLRIEHIVKGVTMLEPGSVVIPHAELMRVASAESGELTLYTDDDNAYVKGHGRQSFPILPEEPGVFDAYTGPDERSFSLPTDGLKKHIRYLQKFTQPDPPSGMMWAKGICFQRTAARDASGGKLTAVAVDCGGTGLASIDYEATMSESFTETIVEANALQAALNGGGDELVVYASPTTVALSCGASVVEARTLSDKFPDWRVLLPGSDPIVLSAHPSVLLEAAQRVGLAAPSYGVSAIRIAVNGDVELFARDHEKAREAREVIECSVAYPPPEAEAFKSTFRLDLLASALEGGAADPDARVEFVPRAKHGLAPKRHELFVRGDGLLVVVLSMNDIYV